MSASLQFADHDFAGLSGVRVVRIATHPDFQGMGYGSRALRLLLEYYQGKTPSVGEGAPLVEPPGRGQQEQQEPAVSLCSKLVLLAPGYH